MTGSESSTGARPDAPVILIGGPPGAGKTTLGRALAARLGFTSLTGDDLATAVRAVTTEESHPVLHLMRRRGGHVRYFTDSSQRELIEDAQALERVMWPAIQRVVEYRAVSGPPVVIDWWLLSPDPVVTIDASLVASLWLHIEPAALEARERTNTDFFEASERPSKMLANFMSRSLWRNELVAARARALGLPLLHQPGDTSTDDLVTEAVAALSDPRSAEP